MSVSVEHHTTLRGIPGRYEVNLSCTFSGDGATYERICRLFTEQIKRAVQERATAAVAEMNDEAAATETDLRTAMGEVLANVTDPTRRKQLLSQFGLEDRVPVSR